MTNSILQTIKKMLGLTEDCDDFDTDIIVNVNAALLSLKQLGVLQEPYTIENQEQTWTDVLGEAKEFEAAKQYVYLKVRQTFDPPSNSFVLTSIENQIKELEWRLMVQAEGRNNEDTG